MAKVDLFKQERVERGPLALVPNWEIRAKFGGDAFRLLGFWDEGNSIVLTNDTPRKRKKRQHRKSTWPKQDGTITSTESDGDEKRFAEIR
jgi:hypothetical protein